MRQRLYIINLALAALLVMLLSGLFKIKVVDQINRQGKQLREQAVAIQALTVSLESLLKIVGK